MDDERQHLALYKRADKTAEFLQSVVAVKLDRIKRRKMAPPDYPKPGETPGQPVGGMPALFSCSWPVNQFLKRNQASSFNTNLR